MANQFVDVNFNQAIDFVDSWMPTISGYQISPQAYNALQPTIISIAPDDVYSQAQATNDIVGASSMARGNIPLHSGDFLKYEINTVEGVQYCKVTIIDSTNTEIDSITLSPYPDNANNLSLVAYLDSNDELAWASVGYSLNGFLILHGGGFNNTVVNLLKPYVYLRNKYEYQVEIQKALRGTDGFQIGRFPTEWFDLKTYGTGEGQSRKYNETVCRLDYDIEHYNTIYDNSAVWWRDPPISTAPQWWFNKNGYSLSLSMGNFLEDNGYSFGSDILRKLPDGSYYNGVDLSTENLAWESTIQSQPDYEIVFSGGKIKLTFNGTLSRHILLLDKDDNILDDYVMPYPTSGGGSSIITGTPTPGRYPGIFSCYLAEHNNHFYLIGLISYADYYDDNNTIIRLSNSTYGTYTIGIAYRILHVFSNEGNALLNKSTDGEKIVPVDPDSLTGDDISNQTTDPEYKTENGDDIPVPKYADGEWDDETGEGIRGSGDGQEIGESSQYNLDEQPDLPETPNIPTAVSTGFMKLYNPTNTEIQNLCAELTQDTFLEDLKKYFGNNPLDFIVGLQVVPGEFTTDNNKYVISYGSYQSSVPMSPITDEFCEIDYGTLDLKEIYGNWEDYNPHTKMSIYLPYIGIKDVDPDRINGTMLKLKYYVDAVTGSILAVLTSVRKDSLNPGAEILVGQWSGQASYTIPLTNIQHNNAVNAVIGVVSAGVSLGAGIATGGVSTIASGALGLATNAILSGAKSGKTDITMQGGVSGSLSFFTGKDAYIQITYPLEGRPDNYNHIVGMPSNITSDIEHQPKNIYIEFVNIDISGIDAPKNEKQMILDLLKGGVYT